MGTEAGRKRRVAPRRRGWRGWRALAAVGVVMASVAAAVPAGADEASYPDAAFDATTYGTPSSNCGGDIRAFGGDYTDDTVTLWVSVGCGADPASHPGWVESSISFAVSPDGQGGPFSVRYDRAGAIVRRHGTSPGQVCTAERWWDGGDRYSVRFPASCIGSPVGFRSTVSMSWREPGAANTTDLAESTRRIWREPPSRTGLPVGNGPQAASADPGTIDVFVRGQDDALWTRDFDGSGWWGWESLGGVITGAPAVVSAGPGELDVFARGQDDRLWTMHFDGVAWSGWTTLGGILATAPAAVSASEDTIDLYVGGMDGALYTRSFDGLDWDPDWSPLGGIIRGAPAAASATDGSISVFARGQDDALWTRSYAGGWTGWTSLGGIITSPPGATSPEVGEFRVFGRGQDNALWERAFVGAWAPWASVGGVIASPPAAVTADPGAVDVFVRGQDGALWSNYHDGQRWTGWYSLGGVLR